MVFTNLSLASCDIVFTVVDLVKRVDRGTGHVIRAFTVGELLIQDIDSNLVLSTVYPHEANIFVEYLIMN